MVPKQVPAPDYPTSNHGIPLASRRHATLLRLSFVLARVLKKRARIFCPNRAPVFQVSTTRYRDMTLAGGVQRPHRHLIGCSHLIAFAVVVAWTAAPNPSTRIPKPQTLKPKPSTLHPKPQTLNPQIQNCACLGLPSTARITPNRLQQTASSSGFRMQGFGSWV